MSDAIAADDFVAGLAGGSIGLLVGYPLDTIKTRMQTSPNKYPGILPSFRLIVKNEKARALFNGMATPLLSMGLFNAMLFGVYGATMRMLNGEDDKNSQKYWHMYCAGCVGGGTATFITCPVENVKVKLQVQTGNGAYKGPIDCITKLLKTGDIAQFYKGFLATFIREFPSSGIYMVTYEVIEHSLSRPSDGTMATALRNSAVTILAGGVSGVLTWASILPVDVVKSRLQADCQVNPKYRGLTHCTLSIYKEGGIRIFYTGLLAMSVRSFPVNAVTFLVYKYLLNYFDESKLLR